MDCNEARTELVGLLRGEDVAAAVTDHLERCSDCRRELEELKILYRLLRRAAPARPAPELQARVLELVALEGVGSRVAAAPLEHQPPVELERAAMDRAGVLIDTRRRGRGTRVLAPTFAAAALLLGVLGLGWRDRAGDMEARLSTLLRNLGPVGSPVGTAVLGGARSDPAPTAELLGYTQRNFRLVLRARDLPVTMPGYHYEVWLRGDGGRVSCGTFRVEQPGHVVFSALVGVDPRSYPMVEVTLEPDDGKPGASGNRRWWGELDL